MSKPWLASATGVRLKVLGAAVLLSMAPATFNAAWAAKDLLQLPAVVAPKAARALTLNIDSRGNRVIVVGERGIVLIRDQGAQAPEGAVKDSQNGFWKQASVPVSVNLTSVKFATDTVVFATGHDGVVLKSADAGNTWKLVFDGNKSNEQVLAAAKAKLDALTQAVEAKRGSGAATPAAKPAKAAKAAKAPKRAADSSGALAGRVLAIVREAGKDGISPADVVTKLNSEVNLALKQPEIAEKLLSLGMTPVGGTPEQFGAFIRADIDKWTESALQRSS